jgi:23S rRNA (guanosine2251-2'-O)-methyltransferase
MNKKETFIYGVHPVLEALQAGKTIDKVWIQEGVLTGQLKDILMELRDRKVIWKQVPTEKLNSLVRGNHQGIVVALSAVDFARLEDVIAMAYEKGEDPFILILDGVTDIRNFGGIARTAACAGVHGILVPEKGGAAINSDAVKTSAGALFLIPVCRTNSMYNSIKTMKNSGLQILGASEKSKEDFYQTDFKGPIAIVMGGEEIGLSTETWKMCDNHFRIPIAKGGVDSLNVSVAAGVAMFEVVRQRQG